MASRSSDYIIRLRANNEQLKTKLAESRAAMRNYNSAMSSLASNAASILSSAFGVGLGVTGLIYATKETVNLIKATQSLNFALKAISDTEEEYAAHTKFLSKIAKDYGLEIQSLTKSYVKWTAAVKGTKLEGEKADVVFDKISRSAAVMGLSVADAEGVFYALQQMVSKGTVSSEELKRQLGDRLPGAFRIMTEALGVSQSVLLKMLQTGELLAEDVLPKFAAAVEKAYGADKVTRVETLTAKQNRLTTAWVEFVKRVDEGDGPISKTLGGMYDWFTKILDLAPLEDRLDKTMEFLKEQGITTFADFQKLDPYDLRNISKENQELIKQRLIAKQVAEGVGIYHQAIADGVTTIEAFNKIKDEYLNQYADEADNLHVLTAIQDMYIQRLAKIKKEREEIAKAKQIPVDRALDYGELFNDDFFNNLTEDSFDLATSNVREYFKGIQLGIGEGYDALEELSKDQPMPDLFGDWMDTVGKRLKEENDLIEEQVSRLSQLLNDTLTASISDFFYTLGSGQGGKAAFAAFLKPISAGLATFGSMLIAQGLGIIAFKESLKTLQGIPAIIAGGALVAVAGAITAGTKNMADGKSFGGGGAGGYSGGGYQYAANNVQLSGEITVKARGRDLVGAINADQLTVNRGA